MGARTICAIVALLATTFLAPATADAKRKHVEEPTPVEEVDKSWCEQGTTSAYVQDGVLYVIGKVTSSRYSAMEASDEKARNILAGIAKNAYIIEELTVIDPSDVTSVPLDVDNRRSSIDACTQYVFDPADAFVGNVTTEHGQEVRGTNYLPQIITEVLNNPERYQPQTPQQLQVQTPIE